MKKMIQSGLLLDRNKLKQDASGFILEEFLANQNKLSDTKPTTLSETKEATNNASV